MNQGLIRAGLALSLMLASTAVWATAPDLAASQQEWAISGDVYQQRKDVDEVSRPSPPSGPTSQTIICSPSTPGCP
jgi:hypothetical protein